MAVYTVQVYAIGAVPNDGNGDPHRDGVNKLNENWAAFDQVFTLDSVKVVAYMGDTANAQMTAGLTLNQGAEDDEIFALKASEINHGVTTITETDTYGFFKKDIASQGGLIIHGLGESGQVRGLKMEATAGTDTTTKSSTSSAFAEIIGRKLSGTGYTNSAAGQNVFAVKTQMSGADRTLFIVDAEGDLHVDGSTSLTAFDAYDDAALVRALDLELAPKTVIESRWDEYVEYNRRHLIEAGILSDGGMVNSTRLQKLHNGALWQLHCEIQELKETIAALTA